MSMENEEEEIARLQKKEEEREQKQKELSDQDFIESLREKINVPDEDEGPEMSMPEEPVDRRFPDYDERYDQSAYKGERFDLISKEIREPSFRYKKFDIKNLDGYMALEEKNDVMSDKRFFEEDIGKGFEEKFEERWRKAENIRREIETQHMTPEQKNIYDSAAGPDAISYDEYRKFREKQKMLDERSATQRKIRNYDEWRRSLPTAKKYIPIDSEKNIRSKNETWVERQKGNMNKIVDKVRGGFTRKEKNPELLNRDEYYDLTVEERKQTLDEMKKILDPEEYEIQQRVLDGHTQTTDMIKQQLDEYFDNVDNPTELGFHEKYYPDHIKTTSKNQYTDEYFTENGEIRYLDNRIETHRRLFNQKQNDFFSEEGTAKAKADVDGIDWNKLTSEQKKAERTKAREILNRNEEDKTKKERYPNKKRWIQKTDEKKGGITEEEKQKELDIIKRGEDFSPPEREREREREREPTQKEENNGGVELEDKDGFLGEAVGTAIGATAIGVIGRQGVDWVKSRANVIANRMNPFRRTGAEEVEFPEEGEVGEVGEGVEGVEGVEGAAGGEVSENKIGEWDANLDEFGNEVGGEAAEVGEGAAAPGEAAEAVEAVEGAEGAAAASGGGGLVAAWFYDKLMRWGTSKVNEAIGDTVASDLMSNDLFFTNYDNSRALQDRIQGNIFGRFDKGFEDVTKIFDGKGDFDVGRTLEDGFGNIFTDHLKKGDVAGAVGDVVRTIPIAGGFYNFMDDIVKGRGFHPEDMLIDFKATAAITEQKNSFNLYFNEEDMYKKYPNSYKFKKIFDEYKVFRDLYQYRKFKDVDPKTLDFKDKGVFADFQEHMSYSMTNILPREMQMDYLQSKLLAKKYP